MRYLVLGVMLVGWLVGWGADFTLRDDLGHQWRNELVTFPLTDAQLAHAKAGHALAGADGVPLPYQLTPKTPPKLAVLVNVEPFAATELSFTNTPAKAASDLRVEETADAIRVTNDVFGVAIAKSLADGAGPIAAVKLPSGAWIGGSRLAGGSPVTAYTAKIITGGPACVVVACHVEFGAAGAWDLTLRLMAHEPVAVVEEKVAVTGAPPVFSLVLDRGWAPDSLFYRRGLQEVGKATGFVETAKLSVADGQPLFVFEPWVHWQNRIRQGNWFALYGEGSPDMLMVGGYRADLWVDLQQPEDTRNPFQMTLARADGELRLPFLLKRGTRCWLLGAPEKAASLAALQEKNLMRAPLPQQVLIKHGNFPLDTVKDYVLRWPGDHTNYPRLFITKPEMARLKAQADPAAIAKTLDYYRNNPLYFHTMEDPIRAFLVTGDAQLGKKLIDFAATSMQGSADLFLKQDGILSYGCAPHGQQQITHSLLLADAVLGSPLLTDDQRAHLLAQAAFIAYAVDRPDYWSPERGMGGFPNMTTFVYSYKATAACLASSHPKAKAWGQNAMTELRRQLEEWSDDNGGWIEAPSYAMGAYDMIFAAFIMGKNAGFCDDVYLPKVRKIIEWFAKTLTPPDSRINGFRHHHPVGNTYLYELTSEFGTMAYLWKDKDPVFASQMQWLHAQSGKYWQPGIGGAFPAIVGYRGMLMDPAIKETPPAYGSDFFPKTGAILRTGFPTDRETQMHVIMGEHDSHYDYDSGSITLWGKGRVLADDFGYYGRAPVHDHSKVETPLSSLLMLPTAFRATPDVDYLAGKADAWARQIVLLKDPDPLRPNYFVLADTLGVTSPATWRLWCATDAVTPNPHGALVAGKEDVDLDVVFTQPAAPVLTTETITRTAGSGMNPKLQWGPMASTQTGLIAAMPLVKGFTAVLYPRLKTEKPPVVTPLADGKGARIDTPAGTDYVFLNAQPFTYHEGDIAFTGTAGVVRLRAGKAPVLWLDGGGSISAAGKTLKSDLPLPKTATNLFPGGDFESGTRGLFPAEAGGTVTTQVYAGNPLKGDATLTGKYCLAVTLAKTEAKRGYIPAGGKLLYVDPLKKYRIAMKIYSPDALAVSIGGYASNGKGGNLLDAKGGTWAWGFGYKGPQDKWTTLETTLGPAGSGAQIAWPDGMFATFLHLHLNGDGGTLYLDDITLEEVP
jgi:hypothetical protein